MIIAYWFLLVSQISAEEPQNFQSGMMSVPVTIRDDARDGASDQGRIVAGTAGFTIKDKGSQVLSPSCKEIISPLVFRVTEDQSWRPGRLGG